MANVITGDRNITTRGPQRAQSSSQSARVIASLWEVSQRLERLADRVEQLAPTLSNRELADYWQSRRMS